MTVYERYVQYVTNPQRPIGNNQHRTQQSKLLCHWPCAVFSPESVVDNAANGALTLWVGSIRRP